MIRANGEEVGRRRTEEIKCKQSNGCRLLSGEKQQCPKTTHFYHFSSGNFKLPFLPFKTFCGTHWNVWNFSKKFCLLDAKQYYDFLRFLHKPSGCGASPRSIIHYSYANFLSFNWKLEHMEPLPVCPTATRRTHIFVEKCSPLSHAASCSRMRAKIFRSGSGSAAKKETSPFHCNLQWCTEQC